MIKNKSGPLILLLLGGAWATTAFAQNAVVSSGGEATGSGGSVSYSLAQISYTTITGTTGSVSQGVQQPYEVGVLTGVQSENNIYLSAFPNPSTDILNLSVGEFKNEELSYQLLDIQGKLLLEARISESNTSINMQDLPKSTYLLHVLGNNHQTIQSFNIIKN